MLVKLSSATFVSVCVFKRFLHLLQVVKKDDGGYSVQPAVSFDCAHKDNGEVIGDYIRLFFLAGIGETVHRFLLQVAASTHALGNPPYR
jgi:hypothetical protein